MSTGRLNLLQGANDYSRTLETTTQNTSFLGSALKGNHEADEVSRLFFSELNINMLQRGMRNRILNKTNGSINIGKQSDDELKIIMRGIYYLHAKNLQFDVVEQVKQLNTLVLDFAVDRILEEKKMNDKYLHDVQNNPVPLPAAINTSVKGSKNIEIKSFM